MAIFNSYFDITRGYQRTDLKLATLNGDPLKPSPLFKHRRVFSQKIHRAARGLFPKKSRPILNTPLWGLPICKYMQLVCLNSPNKTMGSILGVFDTFDSFWINLATQNPGPNEIFPSEIFQFATLLLIKFTISG